MKEGYTIYDSTSRWYGDPNFAKIINFNWHELNEVHLMGVSVNFIPDPSWGKNIVAVFKIKWK